MATTSELQAMDWKLKKDVAESVLTAQGIVFGGYVRDSIIHDYYSEKYYKQCLKDKINSMETTLRYNDPDFYPDLFNRTLIPDDIDCYFDSFQKLKQFETGLINKKFVIHKVFTRENASKYLPRLNVPDHTLAHIRYRVHHISIQKKGLLRKLVQQSFNVVPRMLLTEAIDEFFEKISENLNTLQPIYIDCLVRKDPNYTLNPPFGSLDFECNGLLLSNQGISLCEQLKEKQIPNGFITDINKLKRILEDLYQHRAVLIAHPMTQVADTYRIDKMKEKKWTIVSGEFVHIQTCEKIESETCIICHADLDTDHYKLKCCAARYHKNCLIKSCIDGTAAMGMTQKCLMCKRKIERIGRDVNILQAL